MLKNLSSCLLVMALMTAGLTARADAQSRRCVSSVRRPEPPATSTAGVIYKVVQQTPRYDLSRPEVVSGTRVTLFANFLREAPGCVLFNLNGTSSECKLVQWRPNSVTVDLPRLGLREPKNAEIQIVLPDGRIAKTFPVAYVTQPDIVIHEDTIPQPMPPAPRAAAAVYASPVRGGLILQSGAE